jgi:hypothetical protein
MPPRVYLKENDPVLEVKVSGHGHGLGVFATRQLAANTRVVYIGQEITGAQLGDLQDRQYVVASGKCDKYVDGHPRHLESGRAARINEPSAGQTANMILLMERNPPRPVCVTVRTIPPGSELLMHYGSCFKRSGYRAGQRAKRPVWASRA